MLDSDQYDLDGASGPRTPGEYLKRQMAIRSLTAASLADLLKVSPQTLYNVTGANARPISSNLALRLEKFFNVPADFWLAPMVPEDAEALGTPALAGGAPAFLRGLGKHQTKGPLPGDLLVDYEISKLLREPDSGVRITPFDPERVEPASYDLTVGLIIEKGFKELSQYDWGLVLKLEFERERMHPGEIDFIQSRIRDLGTRVRFARASQLARLASVVIVSREHVAFSEGYCADVGGTAENAGIGLLVNYGFQVDPGYKGPLFVTAIHISPDEEPIRLRTSQRLISLAIRSLPRAPEHDYQEAIIQLAQRVSTSLRKMFAYEPRADGTKYKAILVGGDRTFIANNIEEARDRAIGWVMSAVSGETSLGSDLEAAIMAALDDVFVTRHDARAMIRRFTVADKEAQDEAQGHFEADTDEQTLRDTIKRLQLSPLRCVSALLQELEAPIHSFE